MSRHSRGIPIAPEGALFEGRLIETGGRQTYECDETERVENERRGRPRHLRQGKKLSKGTVVVTEYDASGQLLRSTFYYSTDDRLLERIVEGGSDHLRSPRTAA